MLLFRRREEGEYRWETRGHKYHQIWNNNDSFPKPGTSGQDLGTSGNWWTLADCLGAARNFREKPQRFRESV
jgi:hypothetical protein